MLKHLYESIVNAATRKTLGEYYTPDWLAGAVIERTLGDDDLLDKRILDAACGSGTFVFHAARRYLAAADAAGHSAIEIRGSRRERRRMAYYAATVAIPIDRPIANRPGLIVVAPAPPAFSMSSHPAHNHCRHTRSARSGPEHAGLRQAAAALELVGDVDEGNSHVGCPHFILTVLGDSESGTMDNYLRLATSEIKSLHG